MIKSTGMILTARVWRKDRVMERLTKKVEGYYIMECEDCPSHGDCCDGPRCDDVLAQRLGEYEDAEDAGLLLRLPCRVGDTVYVTDFYYDCLEDKYGSCDLFEHDEVECAGCLKNRKKWFVRTANFVLEMFDYIGKTVFLSREEAEKALEADSNGTTV